MAAVAVVVAVVVVAAVAVEAVAVVEAVGVVMVVDGVEDEWDSFVVLSTVHSIALVVVDC